MLALCDGKEKSLKGKSWRVYKLLTAHFDVLSNGLLNKDMKFRRRIVPIVKIRY